MPENFEQPNGGEVNAETREQKITNLLQIAKERFVDGGRLTPEAFDDLDGEYIDHFITREESWRASCDAKISQALEQHGLKTEKKHEYAVATALLDIAADRFTSGDELTPEDITGNLSELNPETVSELESAELVDAVLTHSIAAKKTDNGEPLSTETTELYKKKKQFQELFPSSDANSFAIEIPSDPTAAGVTAEDFVRRLKKNGWDADRADDLEIIREALMNAMAHGSLGLPGGNDPEFGTPLLLNQWRERLADDPEAAKQLPIDFNIDIRGNTVTVIIHDRGKGFDFKNKEAAANDTLEEQFVEGRGITYLRSKFDKVTYDNNGTTITLVAHNKQKQD